MAVGRVAVIEPEVEGSAKTQLDRCLRQCCPLMEHFVRSTLHVRSSRGRSSNFQRGKGMQKLTRSLAMAGVLAFAGVLAGCGDDVTVKTPTTATVTPPSASIQVGGTVTFTASVSGDVANKTVTWSSSDATKATVDANGKVTGVAVGNST